MTCDHFGGDDFACVDFGGANDNLRETASPAMAIPIAGKDLPVMNQAPVT